MVAHAVVCEPVSVAKHRKIHRKTEKSAGRLYSRDRYLRNCSDLALFWHAFGTPKRMRENCPDLTFQRAVEAPVIADLPCLRMF